MLCTTFKELAEATWEKIDLSKTAQFQLKEETFTDQNLLELKIKHPKEIHTRIFTKHQESENGADWEWWLTDGKDWYGFRVQAKIINIKTDRFEHLHYQGRDSIPQCKKLIEQAISIDETPRFPLYCLYMSTNNLNEKLLKLNQELFGCALISAYEVMKLRRKNKNDLKSLQRFLVPWHKLVCKDPSVSLGDHLNHFLSEGFGEDILFSGLYATDNPPAYVMLAVENDLSESENKYENPGLAGVVVFDLSSKQQTKTD